MNAQWQIDIASPPDRENLVAQIMYGDEQWAEIDQERPELEIEIYPRRDGRPVKVLLSDLVEVIEIARKRLVG